MLGYKALAKLDRKKYREQYGYFIVEGKKAVIEAIESDLQVIQLVVTGSFRNDQSEFLNQTAAKQFVTQKKILEVGNKAFSDIADTSTPQGIAAVVKIPDQNLAQMLNQPLIAVLDDVRDPGNVGTIIRTADWFGVGGLVCLGGADPLQPKVVRSSMGSIFRVQIHHVGRGDLQDSGRDILTHIKEAGYTLVTTQPEFANQAKKTLEEGKDLTQASGIDPHKKICVIFGNEAHGTSPKIDTIADTSFSIPRYGDAESLNVAVSFGVIMSQLKRAQ